MATSEKTMKSGPHFGIRLAVVMAGIGVACVLTTGQAVSSSYKDGESHERHESGTSESKFYGSVEKLPANRIGIWKVQGREILVTKDTRIKEEYGTAAVGSYVEVEGNNSGKNFTAYKVEVKRAKK